MLCPLSASSTSRSGYERVRYRDLTTNLGGPAVRDRLWFFGGYQHLRDYDSQPGADPAFPRTYQQDKIFAKLTPPDGRREQQRIGPVRRVQRVGDLRVLRRRSTCLRDVGADPCAISPTIIGRLRERDR